MSLTRHSGTGCLFRINFLTDKAVLRPPCLITTVPTLKIYYVLQVQMYSVQYWQKFNIKFHFEFDAK